MFRVRRIYDDVLRLPTLLVQEGGYRTQTIGKNARHFLRGLLAGNSRTSS